MNGSHNARYPWLRHSRWSLLMNSGNVTTEIFGDSKVCGTMLLGIRWDPLYSKVEEEGTLEDWPVIGLTNNDRDGFFSWSSVGCTDECSLGGEAWETFVSPSELASDAKETKVFIVSRRRVVMPGYPSNAPDCTNCPLNDKTVEFILFKMVSSWPMRWFRLVKLACWRERYARCARRICTRRRCRGQWFG